MERDKFTLEQFCILRRSSKLWNQVLGSELVMPFISMTSFHIDVPKSHPIKTENTLDYPLDICSPVATKNKNRS